MGVHDQACRVARPIMSADFCEARRHAIGLYRACYRYIPYIVKYHDIPKSEQDVRWKIRERFYRNAMVKDFRIIDILVMKGFMELREISHQWQQKWHVMHNWRPSYEPKPCTFIEKFLANAD